MTVLIIVLAILSCCSNVVLLEVLIKEVPNCANIITFSQFLFIACEGWIFTCHFGTIKPSVPIRNYLILVVMYFAVSVSNNAALSFHVPMPLHMIFKSGSLVTSMLLGMFILNKRYSVMKYISVLMVSVGIFIATCASQHLKDSGGSHSTHQDKSMIGIGLLSFSLLLSAGLGIYQETLFKRYGKHPREALFYSHALPLPGFLLLGNDISSQIPLFNKSVPVPIFPFTGVPKLWLCLIGNVVTQYVCVRGVFTIASTYSSLTVTMIITCRKFISLIFSVIYFQNPFTVAHWMGTALVFAGTLLFVDMTGCRQEKKNEKVL